MEKNAWEVAKKVTAMVDDEPGPAKDYLKCYTMITSNCQFFSNKSYLIKLQNILFLDTTTLDCCIRLWIHSHCVTGEIMILEHISRTHLD